MRWFSVSFWLSLLMGKPLKSVESQPSEISTGATSLLKKSKKAVMKDGQVKESTTKTKLTHGVSQDSSQKKQNSGTKKNGKRRSRSTKRATK